MIGSDVCVVVRAVVGEKVRLGIAAPPSVPVFRSEIYVPGQAPRGEYETPTVRDLGPGANDLREYLESLQARVVYLSRELYGHHSPEAEAAQQRFLRPAHAAA
jgi:hypothetical protein